MLQLLPKKMQQRSNAGFSMLEALLAIIVVIVAGVGVYEAFGSGLSNTNISTAEDEVMQIANVYTDLASSNLTGDVTTAEKMISLLYNSGRLPSNYFSADGTVIANPFGTLDFSKATPTPYGYTVVVPLGCLKAGSTVPVQFYQKVKDLYSCTDCTELTAYTCPVQITLTFSLNN